MWEVENLTPFAAERGWVRDKNGEEVWLVAVKCTFDIHPDGSTQLSNSQPAVNRLPQHWDESRHSSLKYDTDLVLTKTATDVVVVGHAYAPDASPVTQLEVGFRVGPVQKSLRVSGDRVWGVAAVSSPEPFTRMPLVYERAFGGVDRKSSRPERDWDWRNPVGTGFAMSRDNVSGVALPNLEYPDDLVSSWTDRPRPACFGPIASHWQPRAAFAGTYDDQWVTHRQPLLPADFDERFFQSVPTDQQAPGFLRGGEPVVLHRLTPHGDIKCVLPKVFLGFETIFYDGARQVHDSRRLHTVTIESDGPRLSLLWHTALRCHHRVQKLKKTVVTLKTEMIGDAASGEAE